MRRERVTEYWLVLDDCDDVRQLVRGDGTYTVAGTEPPFEDCDFDGLFGLVVLEAERFERALNEPVQTEDEDAADWWPGETRHEIFYWDVTFRMATAEEAVALGLIAPTVGGDPVSASPVHMAPTKAARIAATLHRRRA